MSVLRIQDNGKEKSECCKRRDREINKGDIMTSKQLEDLIGQAQIYGGGLHHAKPDFGEGFCVYNDVVICARYVMEKFSLDRVLVLDTDAHAGNGTCLAFYDDPRVLFVDLHQGSIYPGTGFEDEIGKGKGEGFIVNVPLPA